MTRDEAFDKLVNASDEWNQKQQRVLNEIYDEFETVGSRLVKENIELKERLESFKKLTYRLVADVEEVLYED